MPQEGKLAAAIVDWLQAWKGKRVTVWAGGRSYAGTLLQAGEWGVQIEDELSKNTQLVLAAHIASVLVPGKGAEVQNGLAAR
jgi:hypothetical protein